MNYLLDTNVVSEWTKPQPHAGVTAWLADADEARVFLSVVTLARLRHGVERTSAGARRSRLDGWLTESLTSRFEGRVLPATGETADWWGRIVARAQASGRSVAAVDAWLAATCAQYGMTLVTRDAADFAAAGVPTFNPWL